MTLPPSIRPAGLAAPGRGGGHDEHDRPEDGIGITECVGWHRRLTVAAAIAVGLTGAGATSTFAATPPTAQRVGVAPTAPHGATRTAAPADNTTLHLSIELARAIPPG